MGGGVGIGVGDGVRRGYFGPASVAREARVALLQVSLYLAIHVSSDQPRWMPVAFAMPLTFTPLP